MILVGYDADDCLLCISRCFWAKKVFWESQQKNLENFYKKIVLLSFKYTSSLFKGWKRKEIEWKLVLLWYRTKWEELRQTNCPIGRPKGKNLFCCVLKKPVLLDKCKPWVTIVPLTKFGAICDIASILNNIYKFFLFLGKFSKLFSCVFQNFQSLPAAIFKIMYSRKWILWVTIVWLTKFGSICDIASILNNIYKFFLFLGKFSKLFSCVFQNFQSLPAAIFKIMYSRKWILWVTIVWLTKFGTVCDNASILKNNI